MKKALLIVGIGLMVLGPVFIIAVTAWTMTRSRIYEAEAKLSLREDQADVEAFEHTSVGAGYNPFFLRTQSEIIQSRQILYKVIDNLNLTKEWGRKYNEDKSPISRSLAFSILAGAVHAQPFRDTTLISIQVRLEDGTEAALISNEIAKVYREHRVSEKRNLMMRGVEALEAELAKQQEKVNKAEEELAHVRKDLKSTAGGSPLVIDQKKLAAMQGDLVVARVDRLTRKARLDQIKGLNDEDLLSVQQFIMGDAALSSLRQQITDTQVTLKLMLENLGESHPDVKRLKANQDELRKRFRDGLLSMKKGLEVDWQVANAKYEVLEKELHAIKEAEGALRPEDSMAYNRAERKLETERVVLAALKARLAQECLVVGIPRSPVEVIDPAEPSNVPVSPNLIANVTIAAVVAGMLFLPGLLMALVALLGFRKKSPPALPGG